MNGAATPIDCGVDAIQRADESAANDGADLKSRQRPVVDQAGDVDLVR